jgi:protoporphyrin/coproporphyrin ferrochelatase
MVSMPAYDAFLLLSFGGPEGPDDVLPFLENVTRGRGVPAERLAEVAEHYYAVGGASPINAQCRELLANIRAAGLDLPMYWGNRNWRPFLTDTVREMADAGVERAIAFVTSAYSSYSACRQYYDDLDQAIAAVGARAPRIDKIRPYFNHPGFIEPFAAGVADALATLPGGAQGGARLVCTAHSVPVGMAAASGSRAAGTAAGGAGGGRYAAELGEASRLIAERAVVGSIPFDLVYQSRSGPPSVPWLAPDVNDYLRLLAAGATTNPTRATGVVVAPVGFVSDHMEVVHDLDVEAAQTAASLGLPFARAKAPGSTPRFAQMVCELVAERTAGAPALALGAFGLGAFAGGADACPADCCRYSPPRPGGAASPGRAARPGSLTGTDAMGSAR